MTWLDLPADHPFGLANLPYGVFSTAADPSRRVGVRIGDQVLDAARAAAAAGYEAGAVWASADLNAYLAQGRSAWDAGRAWLTQVLGDAAYRSVVEPHLVPVTEVTMHLPIDHQGRRPGRVTPLGRHGFSSQRAAAATSYPSLSLSALKRKGVGRRAM